MRQCETWPPASAAWLHTELSEREREWELWQFPFFCSRCHAVNNISVDAFLFTLVHVMCLTYFSRHQSMGLESFRFLDNVFSFCRFLRLVTCISNYNSEIVCVSIVLGSLGDLVPTAVVHQRFRTKLHGNVPYRSGRSGAVRVGRITITWNASPHAPSVDQ